jgi:molybdopterin-guanine dinucleotide biosynthesis protein A
VVVARGCLALDLAAGFVLAGGRSSRMGSDKALQIFAGRPLIGQALGLMEQVGVAGLIAGSRSPLGSFATEIPDTYLDAGPLGGIHAALTATQADLNLFIPVDVPLIPPSLLRCLLLRASLTGAAVTASRLNGRLEPFPVVLRRDVLPLIARELDGGAARSPSCRAVWEVIPEQLGSLLDAPSVETLLQCGQVAHPLGLPPVLWFQNANTPVDLARVNLFATGPSPS